MYSGTWKTLSRISAPPIMTTARTTIARTSAIDLTPGPDENAERLVMPTSWPSPDLALNSGMASVLLNSTSLGSDGGRIGRRTEATLLLAEDFQLDRVGKVEDLSCGHDLERTRARERHLVLVGYPSRACAHDNDPVGQENRLLDRVGDEHDRRARIEPDLLDQPVHLLAGEAVQGAERLV